MSISRLLCNRRDKAHGRSQAATFFRECRFRLGPAIFTALFAIAPWGCSELRLTLRASQCINPKQEFCATPKDAQVLPLRIFQLQKDVDPMSMGIRWDEFRDAPRDNPVPERLRKQDYLSDPKLPDYPVVMTTDVAPGEDGRLPIVLPLHKSTQYLLLTTLGNRSQRYSMQHIKLLPFQRRLRLCIDHFDVFPDCRHLKIDVAASRCPNPLGLNCNYAGKIRIFQLRDAMDDESLRQARSIIATLPEGASPPPSLQQQLSDPEDPGSLYAATIDPDHRATLQVRHVKGRGGLARVLLLAMVGHELTTRSIRVVDMQPVSVCVDRNSIYLRGEEGFTYCQNAIEGGS